MLENGRGGGTATGTFPACFTDRTWLAKNDTALAAVVVSYEFVAVKEWKSDINHSIKLNSYRKSNIVRFTPGSSSDSLVQEAALKGALLPSFSKVESTKQVLKFYWRKRNPQKLKYALTSRSNCRISIWHHTLPRYLCMIRSVALRVLWQYILLL